MNNIASAKQELEKLDNKLADAVYEVEQERIKILSALQAHVKAHEKVVSQHQSEIDLARQMISRVAPAPAQEFQTPEFVLSGTKSFVSKTWRYWVGGVMVVLIIAGKIYLP